MAACEAGWLVFHRGSEHLVPVPLRGRTGPAQWRGHVDRAREDLVDACRRRAFSPVSRRRPRVHRPHWPRAHGAGRQIVAQEGDVTALRVGRGRDRLRVITASVSRLRRCASTGMTWCTRSPDDLMSLAGARRATVRLPWLRARVVEDVSQARARLGKPMTTCGRLTR